MITDEERTQSNDPASPCADYEWMVGPYLDGELPNTETTRLQEHLQGCHSCGTLAEHLRNLDQLAGRVLSPVPSVSGAEWGTLWEGITRQRGAPDTPERRPGRMEWLLPALALAALLLLGAWLGTAFLHRPGDEMPEPDTVRIEELDDINVIHFSG